jgi:hypothetical protein
MKVFNPTTWSCCVDEIVVVPSLNPTVVPLIQSIGDLPLERALLMSFASMVHSRSIR